VARAHGLKGKKGDQATPYGKVRFQELKWNEYLKPVQLLDGSEEYVDRTTGREKFADLLRNQSSTRDPHRYAAVRVLS
jgi:hypothetical protein